MKKLLTIALFLFISACDSKNEEDYVIPKAKPDEELLGKTVDEYQEIVKEQKATEDTDSEATALDWPVIEKGYKPIQWEGLIAPGYDVDSILKKYQPMIELIEHGSEDGAKLYKKMQDEYDKAPPNENLANEKVSIPGFIAPLEQSNGIITEFLLVPYFGACIHQPAPPSNQTVHVKTAPEFGIDAEDSYDPIWVTGELLLDNTTTDIGSASYKVDAAKIQKYDLDY